MKIIKIILFILIIIVLEAHLSIGENEENTNSITLSFVGDLFLQKHLSNSYYNPKTNNYYFPERIFTDIKDYVNKDFSFIVLDTPITTLYPPSGYPLYNSPVEILDTLKKIGFNVMITAGNHALDKGEKGLIETIENIRKRNLLYVGTNAKKEDREKYLILKKNGIKVGILAYTFSTNGIPLPKGKEFLVNLIDLSIIKNDLKNIKDLCDFIIVYLHWGNIEYLDTIEKSQRRLAKEITNWGADIIVGSHPHVIKAYENINGKWCFYSLGNFFTDQYGLNRPEVKYGYILIITLSKFNKRVYLTDKKIIPTFILRERRKNKFDYKILKAEEVKNLPNIEIKDKIYYERLQSLLLLGEDYKK